MREVAGVVVNKVAARCRAHKIAANVIRGHLEAVVVSATNKESEGYAIHCELVRLVEQLERGLVQENVAEDSVLHVPKYPQQSGLPASVPDESPSLSPPRFLYSHTDELGDEVYGILVLTLLGDWIRESMVGREREIADSLALGRVQYWNEMTKKRTDAGLSPSYKLLLLDLFELNRLSSSGEAILDSFVRFAIIAGFKVAIRMSRKNASRLHGLSLRLFPTPTTSLNYFDKSRRQAALWLYGRPDWEAEP